MTAPAVANRRAVPVASLGVSLREPVARLRRFAPAGTVLFTALVGQVAVAPHLQVGGAAPDVLLVGVVAMAAGRGARAGAAFGFAAGLGADVFLATPLGTSALAFTLLGHVLGQARRPRSSTTAGALCSPASTCFACRTGRPHGAEAEQTALRPARRSRRAMARRTALRRSLILTAVGVVVGRLAVAVVATTLGGVPFPDPARLLHLVAVGVVSAPLGPALFAVVRRLAGAPGGRP